MVLHKVGLLQHPQNHCLIVVNDDFVACQRFTVWTVEHTSKLCTTSLNVFCAPLHLCTFQQRTSAHFSNDIVYSWPLFSMSCGHVTVEQIGLFSCLHSFGS